MSGPKPKSVPIFVGGFVVPPPINRQEAETAFGAPLGDAAWSRIVKAFSDFGMNRDALVAAPRVNADRNDPRSYPSLVGARRRSCAKP